MKKLWMILAILLTFTLTMEAAEARRFGGGKTFGRTYQTAPAQPSSAGAAAQRQQASGLPSSPTAAPAARTPGRGLMGGLLGGLLVGGLFAALFAGGAFHGLQLMDVLLMALLAWVAIKVIRSLRQGGAQTGTAQPAYAHAGAAAGAAAAARQSAPPVFGSRQAAAEAPAASSLSAVAASPAVPFNLPLGFDTPAFLTGATEHYRILQDAWSRNDLAKIREYVTPELYADLQAERATLPGEQHTEVMTVNAELVRADQQFGEAEVSIRFSGRYRDTVEVVEEDFTDIWHLMRDYSKDDAPWHITGIESV